MHFTGSTIPRIYGLAKTHKEGTPLRPVLSTVNSIYHKIASKIAKWLSVVPQTQININSKQVVKEIKDTKLDVIEKTISFDIKSLYMNVPAMESLKCAADLLYNNDEYMHCLPPVSKSVFLELGKLALNDVVMLTTEGYYTQTTGLAMGLPLSPLLVNAWLT